MIFKELSKSRIEEVLTTYTLAFSDYFVAVKSTIEQFQFNNKSYNTDFELSVGAYDDQLVGFILHAFKKLNGNSILYNAGTGVIPKNRGHKLTFKMYEYILPKLKEIGISKIYLEVITQNHAAIKSYSKIGFKTTRNFDCFRGNICTQKIESNLVIKELQEINWDILSSFWDFEPTWQNAIESIRNSKKELLLLGAFQNSSLVGYLIYNPKTSKIMQFATHKENRNKGVCKELFHSLSLRVDNEVFITNVNIKSTNTISLIKKVGLKSYIQQNEMILDL
jgi:predicted acetyltransferase